MIWLVWGLVLIAQNAAFTLVSRARNSKSIVYHALASVPSNGGWFLSNFFLFTLMTDAIASKDWWLIVRAGLFYTACTMIGSVGMHWLALHKIEKGRVS